METQSIMRSFFITNYLKEREKRESKFRKYVQKKLTNTLNKYYPLKNDAIINESDMKHEWTVDSVDFLASHFIFRDMKFVVFRYKPSQMNISRIFYELLGWIFYLLRIQRIDQEKAQDILKILHQFVKSDEMTIGFEHSNEFMIVNYICVGCSKESWKSFSSRYEFGEAISGFHHRVISNDSRCK